MLTILFHFQPASSASVRISKSFSIASVRSGSQALTRYCVRLSISARTNDQFRQPSGDTFTSVPTKPDLYTVRSSWTFLTHLQPVNLWVFRVQTLRTPTPRRRSINKRRFPPLSPYDSILRNLALYRTMGTSADADAGLGPRPDAPHR